MPETITPDKRTRLSPKRRGADRLSKAERAEAKADMARLGFRSQAAYLRFRIARRACEMVFGKAAADEYGKTYHPPRGFAISSIRERLVEPVAYDEPGIKQAPFNRHAKADPSNYRDPADCIDPLGDGEAAYPDEVPGDSLEAYGCEALFDVTLEVEGVSQNVRCHEIQYGHRFIAMIGTLADGRTVCHGRRGRLIGVNFDSHQRKKTKLVGAETSLSEWLQTGRLL